jgi:hypothetical protein
VDDDDDIVVDDEFYIKNDLLLPPPTTGSSSSELLTGTRLSFSSPLPLGDEGGKFDENGLRRGARSDAECDDGERGRRKTAMASFVSSPEKKSMNDIPCATSHDLLETTLHPHTPRGIMHTAASASEEQFHIMDDLEVSPIIRLPEDYFEHEMMVDNTVDNDDKAKKGTATASSANSIQPLFHHSASPILPNKGSDDFSSLRHHHTSNNEEDVIADAAINALAESSSDVVTFYPTAPTVNINTNASASQETSVNTTNKSTATIPTDNKNTTTSTLNNTHNTSNDTAPASTTHRPTAQGKLRRPVMDTSAVAFLAVVVAAGDVA